MAESVVNLVKITGVVVSGIVVVDVESSCVKVDSVDVVVSVYDFVDSVVVVVVPDSFVVDAVESVLIVGFTDIILNTSKLSTASAEDAVNSFFLPR